MTVSGTKGGRPDGSPFVVHRSGNWYIFMIAFASHTVQTQEDFIRGCPDLATLSEKFISVGNLQSKSSHIKTYLLCILGNWLEFRCVNHR